MEGLKTHESSKFEKFFALVQAEARKKRAVFFLFAGEGRDIVKPDMEGEDLSGWLIPEEQAAEFETAWKQDDSMEALGQWSEFFQWAEWQESNNKIKIVFQKYGE